MEEKYESRAWIANAVDQGDWAKLMRRSVFYSYFHVNDTNILDAISNDEKLERLLGTSLVEYFQRNSHPHQSKWDDGKRLLLHEPFWTSLTDIQRASLLFVQGSTSMGPAIRRGPGGSHQSGEIENTHDMLFDLAETTGDRPLMSAVALDRYAEKTRGGSDEHNSEDQLSHARLLINDLCATDRLEASRVEASLLYFESHNANDKVHAVDCLMQCVHLREQAARSASDHDVLELSSAYHALADALQVLHRRDQSLEWFDRAISKREKLWVKSRDLAMLGLLINSVCSKANVLVAKGEMDLALQVLLSAHANAEPHSSQSDEKLVRYYLRLCRSLAECYFQKGELRLALNHVLAAEECHGWSKDSTRSSDPFEMAETASLKSRIQEHLGELDDAFASMRNAIDITESTKVNSARKTEKLSKFYLNYGNLLETLERTSEAKPFHAKSVQLRRELYAKNPQVYGRQLVNSMSSFGACHQRLDQDAEVIPVLEEARKLSKAFATTGHTKDTALHARVSHNLGVSYSKVGKFELGFKLLSESVRIKEELCEAFPGSFLESMVVGYGCLAYCCEKLGWIKRGEFYHRKGVAIWEQMHARGMGRSVTGLAISRATLAVMLVNEEGANADRLNEAIELAKSAQQLVASSQSGHAELDTDEVNAFVHGATALVFKHSGDTHRSLAALQLQVQFLEESRSSTPLQLAVALLNQSRTHQSLGELDNCECCILESVRIFRKETAGHIDGFDAMLFCCEFLADREDPDHEQITELLGELETRAKTLDLLSISPGNKNAVRLRLLRLYQFVIRYCHGRILAECPSGNGLPDRYLSASDAVRSRILREAAQEVASPERVSPELLARFEQAQERLRLHHARETATLGLDAVPEVVARHEDLHSDPKLHPLVDEFAACISEILDSGGRVSTGAIATNNVRLEDVRLAIATNEAVVQFSLLEDATYICVITKTREEFHRIERCSFAYWKTAWDQWSRGHKEFGLSEDAKGWKDWNQRIESQLSTLSADLLAPVMTLLSSVERVVFVLNRQLHAIPIHAWPVGDGKRLVDTHVVSYSAGFSEFCSSRSSASSLAEIDPMFFGQGHRDNSFELECKVVMSSLGLDSQIRGANEIRDFGSYSDRSLIHYAGHARFSSTGPIDSVLGSEDRPLLSVAQILQECKFQNCGLFVLNGCETGMVLPNPLDDHIGFPQALLAKNVRVVVSTLWKVLNLPATLVMYHFYSSLREGLSVADSLNDSINWLRGHGDRLGRAIRSGEDLMDVLNAISTTLAADDRGDLLYAGELWEDLQEPPFEAPIYWAAFYSLGDGSLQKAR
ncbi:MAG: CHAT domain-containing protein [Planctomycetota bacterium]